MGNSDLRTLRPKWWVSWLPILKGAVDVSPLRSGLPPCIFKVTVSVQEALVKVSGQSGRLDRNSKDRPLVLKRSPEGRTSGKNASSDSPRAF